MRSYLATSFLCILILCYTDHSYAQPGQWTWMHGSNTYNSAGVYGTQGVPDPVQTPPALQWPVTWTDLEGNFWLFGGAIQVMAASPDQYSDLWKYNVSTNEWTWIKGPGIPNQPGIYGTKGVASPSNNPGARSYLSKGWTDSNGDLWLFGSRTIDPLGNIENLNDLWKYNIATNQWTWVRGGNQASSSGGHYGTVTVPDPLNDPPARRLASSTWIDKDGNFWLFGGDDGSRNDLWKYDPAANVWTWMKGSNTLNAPSIFGIPGVPDPANTPGAREPFAAWTDPQGNLWLFGGYSYPNFTPAYYNDLWKYEVSTNQWVLIGGSAIPNDTGSYNGKCMPSPLSWPRCRFKSQTAWTDPCGGFWLFGGGADMTYNKALNDIWYFDPSTNEWALAAGDVIPNQSPVHGTKGVAALANTPGSRLSSVSWRDKQGNLWLFGGNIINVSGTNFNDLWKFTPDPACRPATNNTQTQSIITADTLTGCAPLTISFGNNSLDADHYLWSFDDGKYSTLHAPQHTFMNKGEYTVTLVTNPGCGGRDSTTVNVKVEDCVELYVPNVFTPNGDGINNEFSINVRGYEKYDLVIYNRWGRKVFTTETLGVNWNGRMMNDGPEVEEGVYFYIVSVVDKNNNPVQRKGFVALQR